LKYDKSPTPHLPQNPTPSKKNQIPTALPIHIKFDSQLKKLWPHKSLAKKQSPTQPQQPGA